MSKLLILRLNCHFCLFAFKSFTFSCWIYGKKSHQICRHHFLHLLWHYQNHELFSSYLLFYDFHLDLSSLFNLIQKNPCLPSIDYSVLILIPLLHFLPFIPILHFLLFLPFLPILSLLH